MTASNLKKVIIWGFPLYSHTHSYTHYAFYKAFKYMGYETYWFHDKDYPTDFDYKNCLFLTEGYADSNIPLEKSSTYFVHMCRNPLKYLDASCRVVDIRYNVTRTKDYTYDYAINKSMYEKLDLCTYYEANASDEALREKYRKYIQGYEAIYTSWATDLVPSEINFEDRFLQRESKIWYIGSLWSANRSELMEYKRACDDNGIEFISHDPWKNPVTVDEGIKLIKRSYMAPDIRGSGVTCDEVTAADCNHLDIGYIPCRTFKNISYGHLGITNSPAVNELFEGRIIFDTNPYNLFEKGASQLQNYDLIKEQMEYVKTNHTFVNRINSILQVYNKQ